MSLLYILCKASRDLPLWLNSWEFVWPSRNKVAFNHSCHVQFKKNNHVSLSSSLQQREDVGDRADDIMERSSLYKLFRPICSCEWKSCLWTVDKFLLSIRLMNSSHCSVIEPLLWGLMKQHLIFKYFASDTLDYLTWSAFHSFTASTLYVVHSCSDETE